MANRTIGGLALLLGGALTLFANSILTPLLPGGGGAEAAASEIFLARLSILTLAMLLLMIGSISLHRAQAHKTGAFGAIAFALAFLGGAFLFAHEWGQVFFVHHLARVAPDALQAMEDVAGPNPFDIEAIAVLSTFTLGWIGFSISMLKARVFSPLGPALIILGFFAVPLLTALAHGALGEAYAIWGAVAGNVVLSLGWILLGWSLSKRAAA